MLNLDEAVVNAKRRDFKLMDGEAFFSMFKECFSLVVKRSFSKKSVVTRSTDIRHAVLNGFVLSAALASSCCLASAVPLQRDLSSRLAAQNALFVRYEKSSERGNAQVFPDRSVRTLARENHQNVRLRAQLAAISTEGFAEQDRISHNLLMRELDQNIKAYDLKLYEMPLAEGQGTHHTLANLADDDPFRSSEDYKAYLDQLRQIPWVLQQTEGLAKLGERDGVVPARYLLEKVPGECDNIVAKDPFLKPLKNFPASMAPTEQARITAQITKTVTDQVLPAYRGFRDFVQNEYIPHARAEIGLSSLPHGAELYQFAIYQQTTTKMTAAEVHALGLREVARIEALLLEDARKAGYQDLASYRAALKSDPKYRPTSPEQIVDDFRRYVTAMQPRLPELFNDYPKTLLTVEAGSLLQPGFGTHHVDGPADGSRPGRVVVAVSNYAQRSLISDETQAYHEGIPGHELQVTIQQHLKGLPKFRTEIRNTAYIEGWAVYAEALGKEIGFFQDPASDYGRLNLELMRAVRLVVDTGINADGWTRDQAAEYFRASGAADEPSLQAEIDRYINWPAQSLGYKIGQMKFLELRQRAKSVLGDQFDIRAFHDAVLNSGSLPLDLLEAHFNEWIETQKRDPKALSNSR
jgi:uncharacterized protein (DUF885 family)